MEPTFKQKEEELREHGIHVFIYAEFPITWKEFDEKYNQLFWAENKYLAQKELEYPLGYHNLLWTSMQGAKRRGECNEKLSVRIDPHFEGYVSWDYQGLQWLIEFLGRIDWDG